MSTTFDFPANPTVGQIHTLPSGDQVEWNGYAWSPVDTTTLTYPIAINRGGTGATTAPQALTNLGLVFPIPIAQGGTGQATAVAGLNALGGLAKAGDTMTGVLKLADGAVGTPPLAFGSEAGLGLYRSSPSAIAFVAGGQSMGSISAGGANASYLTVAPRAGPGIAQISLFNIPNAQAGTNANWLSISQEASGTALIRTGIYGSNTRGNLLLDAPSVYFQGSASTVAGNMAINNPGTFAVLSIIKTVSTMGCVVDGRMAGVTRWSMYLGDQTAEPGNGTGSDFAIVRHDDGGGYIDTALFINRNSGQLQLRGGGLSYTGTGSPFRTVLTHYVPDGRMVLARDDSNWSNGTLQIYRDHAEIVVNNGSSQTLNYSPGTSGLAVQGLVTTSDGASVAAQWIGDRHSFKVVVSARRFKKDFRPLADGALAKVAALKPLTYVSSIEGDTPDRLPGFVAEDFVDAGLPEYVNYQGGEVQSLKYDRVTALLAKALQEVSARLKALEAK